MLSKVPLFTLRLLSASPPIAIRQQMPIAQYPLPIGDLRSKSFRGYVVLAPHEATSPVGSKSDPPHRI
ncbi:hypothetical protein DSO57_1010530 [Entomophthora muscae]|uniref:Uncharacterized protein n=1 Tax=Entomophthora muscae TaxID=34485 RepID=A0ACC2U4S4_9FUNG|nr:hypothetical protein DSO57_1010530 [Entomophthora muscae]